MHRSQLIQTGPATIRLRLELKAGVDAEKTWREVIAKLNAYLAHQHLGNLELIRASELPEQPTRFGKFRHVIARPPATG